jgi:hypothetical protein
MSDKPPEKSLQRHEEVLCGVPLWLIEEYLMELGGQLSETHQVFGQGWQVSLFQIEDYTIGSLRVGQVKLVLEAEEDVFEHLLAGINKKLIRAGG